MLRFFSTWWKKFISVAIFLIEKSFHFLFLPPHISTSRTKPWFHTIKYRRPDQLILFVALYGQRRSLFPISQATEQSCHYINFVTEKHFFHFWGSRCISSHFHAMTARNPQTYLFPGKNLACWLGGKHCLLPSPHQCTSASQSAPRQRI